MGRPFRSTLGKNPPNLLNSYIFIPGHVPKFTEIGFAVYNLSGQQLILLRRGYYQRGRHVVHWDGRDESGNQQLVTGVQASSPPLSMPINGTFTRLICARV